jgi:hypothetical protein
MEPDRGIAPAHVLNAFKASKVFYLPWRLTIEDSQPEVRPKVTVLTKKSGKHFVWQVPITELMFTKHFATACGLEPLYEGSGNCCTPGSSQETGDRHGSMA